MEFRNSIATTGVNIPERIARAGVSSRRGPRYEQRAELRAPLGIVGASGYAGGELLRLLLAHPGVTITQITSERHIGKFATRSTLICADARSSVSSAATRLQPCDVLFLALPHGEAQTHISALRRAGRDGSSI